MTLCVLKQNAQLLVLGNLVSCSSELIPCISRICDMEAYS